MVAVKQSAEKSNKKIAFFVPLTWIKWDPLVFFLYGQKELIFYFVTRLLLRFIQPFHSADSPALFDKCPVIFENPPTFFDKISANILAWFD